MKLKRECLCHLSDVHPKYDSDSMQCAIDICSKQDMQ